MKKLGPHRAFTLTAQGGLLRALKTDCRASAAFDPRTTPESKYPPHELFTAIWDTGATHSVITQDVVARCGLQPVGMTRVHGVDGETIQPQYLINMGLPNGVGIPQILVTLGKLVSDTHMLVGMDIITRGDFSITNVRGNTIFTFRMPSLVPVDFVKQQHIQTVMKGTRGSPNSSKQRRRKAKNR